MSSSDEAGRAGKLVHKGDGTGTWWLMVDRGGGDWVESRKGIPVVDGGGGDDLVVLTVVRWFGCREC